MTPPQPAAASPRFALAAIALISLYAGLARAAESALVTTTSPDGRVEIDLCLTASGQRDGIPSYSIRFAGKPLLTDSPLGLVFKETGPLTAGLRAVSATRRSADDTYPVIAGKRATARDHYNETTVVLEETAHARRQLHLVFRAYDDGVAFRYLIPKQAAISGDFVLTDEQSHFRPAGDPETYFLPFDRFVCNFENYYRSAKLSQLPPKTRATVPLLLHFTDGPWAVVTEADLSDYAGMWLTPAAAGPPGDLVTTLPPWPGQTEVKVKGTTPFASSWRVVMVADDPGRLIESDLIANLNPPCAIHDTSWIKPGKVSFLWWNGYVVEGENFKGDINTPTIKHYIDFAAAKGIPYVSLDGFHKAWYGGPIPYAGADITQATPELDLPEVLRYAHDKGIRLRLWIHSQGLRKHIDRALPIYEKWGIEGIMVDFFDRDDQETVRFVSEIVRKAADHHLTVSLHNIYKPTGLSRTYPNLLAYESVLNLEYNKWSTGGSRGSTPAHELTVPFVRMLAGPMDFHTGGFRSVRPADFHAQNIAPLLMGTRCHMLAMYVVYDNPLPMVADYPAAYRGQAGLDFLTDVPATWDDTRVLNAHLGDTLTIARRKGDRWYLGSMAGDQARDLDIPLRFLGPGTFSADVYADDPAPDASPEAAVRRTQSVTAADTLYIHLAPAGGQVVRFSPAHSDNSH